MKTLVIKTNNSLQSASVMFGGFMIKNPTGGLYPNDETPMYVFTRVEGANPSTVTLKLRSYNGKLYTGTYGTEISNNVTLETIDNVVVRTYTIAFNNTSAGASVYYTINGVQERYIGKNVKFESGVSRIDVLGEDWDIRLMGAAANDYANPLWVTADQLKYSTIPSNGKTIYFKNITGTVHTEWFKENTGIRRFEIGGKAEVAGSIMDYVNSYATLCNFLAVRNVGLTGVMSEFLNALAAKGTVNRNIEFNIANTSIVNDVTPQSTQTHFQAAFDAQGAYTITVL